MTTLIDELLKELPKLEAHFISKNNWDKETRLEHKWNVAGWNAGIQAVRELLEGKREK